LRLDKIPLLIEIVRKYEGHDPAVISQLISMRSEDWAESDPDVKKIQRNMMISQAMHKLLDSDKQIAALKKDTDFLSNRTEYFDLGKEIDRLCETYNSKVRHYNKLRGFILIRPFLAILKYRKLMVFEFEP
jgi:hypothetical protein